MLETTCLGKNLYCQRCSKLSLSPIRYKTITATQTFIEAVEMQECTGTNIQDDIYQSSKDEMFAKVNCHSSTRQPNCTYLQNMINHDQTKQDSNTQQHSFVSDISGQTLWHLDHNESCSKCSVTWLDHVNKFPKKTNQTCPCASPANLATNITVAMFFIGTLYWWIMLTVPTGYFYLCHSKQKATSFTMLVGT